jgi:SMC interacting uncharacterized protein involved in chromosome segregation
LVKWRGLSDASVATSPGLIENISAEIKLKETKIEELAQRIDSLQSLPYKFLSLDEQMSA